MHTSRDIPASGRLAPAAQGHQRILNTRRQASNKSIQETSIQNNMARLAPVVMDNGTGYVYT